MNDEPFGARSNPSNNGPDPEGNTHPSVEELSEYLDATPRERTANWQSIEGHLQSCPACRAVLNDLHVMVQMLQSLPEIEAPQRYAVPLATDGPAMEPAASEPIRLQETPQWHIRHAAKVRWATAVAAMLFVFVLSADLVTNGLRPGVSNDNDMAPMMTSGEAEMDQSSMSVPTAAAASELEQDEAEEEESADEPPADQGYQDEMPAEESESFGATDDSAEDSARMSDGDEATGEETVSALSVELEELPAEAESETQTRQVDSDRINWRIAQVSLAIVLALLLAVLVGLPRQGGKRQS